jgi:curli biogenesis system outer membrane secretion channel CsgG
MFNKPSTLLFIIFCSVLLSGCAKKIEVKFLEPAEIERAGAIKRIAVLPFKHDNYGFSGKVEALLAKKRLDGKQYFTVVSRKHITSISREQHLQYSGLLNEEHSVELGELIGAQALVLGEVVNADKNDSHYQVERKKCLDKKCKSTQTYFVNCTKRQINLSVNIQIVDVGRGDIIYGDAMQKEAAWSKCADDSHALISKSQGLGRLTKEMANEFVYKLTPNYKVANVVFLDDPDIEYTERQLQLLEYSYTYLGSGRLKKAEQLLSELFQSTHYKSYVAAYNLGLVKEVLGLYDDANTYYQIADELQVEPVDAINWAVIRIQQRLQQ